MAEIEKKTLSAEEFEERHWCRDLPVLDYLYVKDDYRESTGCCRQGVVLLNIIWRRSALTREVDYHRQRLSTSRCRARK
jgi:hypothetical protein